MFPLYPIFFSASIERGQLQILLQIIQYPFFIRRPQRRDQILFRTVAGDAVHHDVLRQLCQTALQPLGVFFQCQAGEFPVAIVFFQIRPLQHMKQVKFHAVGARFYRRLSGFGSHLNLQNAAAIGLIPEELVSKAKVIGNAALAGASRLLLDPSAKKEIRAIAESSRHFNLGGNPVFNNNYMEKMLFPYFG